MVGQGPVHVTHIVFDLDGGGLESLVGAMAKHFAQTEIVMSVVSLSGREGRVAAAARPYLHRFETFRPVRGVSMVAPVRIVRALKALRPDVVHLHNATWFKGALAARMAGVPAVVYTEHGREHNDPWLQRSLDRSAVRWTDVVVAVSDRLRSYVHRVLGVPEERLRTIENGVDLERFKPGPAPAGTRARLDVPSDAILIGSVGRLEPVKAYDQLIEALALLRARLDGSRSAYVAICGEGSERPALLAAAQRAGVADAVRLPGWVDDPLDVYRALDVFALSSRSEGVSISLLEAMACGTPPVVTAVGANAEILGPELASQVVPPGDPAALANAIARSLGTAGRLEEIGVWVRRRVAERYDLRLLLRRYAALYRELVSRPGSR